MPEMRTPQIKIEFVCGVLRWRHSGFAGLANPKTKAHGLVMGAMGAQSSRLRGKFKKSSPDWCLFGTISVGPKRPASSSGSIRFRKMPVAIDCFGVWGIFEKYAAPTNNYAIYEWDPPKTACDGVPVLHRKPFPMIIWIFVVVWPPPSMNFRVLWNKYYATQPSPLQWTARPPE